MTVGLVTNSLGLNLPGNFKKRFSWPAGDFSILLNGILPQPYRPEPVNDLAGNESSFKANADRNREKVAVSRERESYEASSSRQAAVEVSQPAGSENILSEDVPEGAKNFSGPGSECSDLAAGHNEAKLQGNQVTLTGVADWRQPGFQAEALKGEVVAFSGGQQRVAGPENMAAVAEMPLELALEDTAVKAASISYEAELQLTAITEELSQGLKGRAGAAGEALKTIDGNDLLLQPGDRTDGAYTRIEAGANHTFAPVRDGSEVSAGRQSAAALEGKLNGSGAAAVVEAVSGQGLGKGGTADTEGGFGKGSPAGSQVSFGAFLNGLHRPGGSTGLPVSNTPAVLASIMETARLARLGSQQELEIQLRPESLGNLKIRALMAGNDLTLHLLVESNAAARALQSMAAEMRQAASQQGLSLDQIQVQVQTSGEGFGGETHRGSQDGYRQENGWQQQADWQGEPQAAVETHTWYHLNYLA